MFPNFVGNIKFFFQSFCSLKHIRIGKAINPRQWTGLSYLLFIAIFIIICTTFLDYGISWDEIARKYYGNSVLAWYFSFFKSQTAISDITGNMYGGFFESIAQFAACTVAYLTENNYFETRHFINAIFGLAGIIYAYKLGSLLSNRMGGFLSALFLLVTPRYYGHMFNNSKDLPFAILFLASVYYIVVSYRQLPRLSKKMISKIGISIGLTLGVRIGGIILFGYLALLIFFWLIIHYKFNSQKKIPVKETCQAALSSILIFVIAWITMLLWWPWAQISPILHPIKALTTASKFPWNEPVLYKGSIVRATNLPLDYVPTWLSISLPEFYFITILLGYCFCIHFLINHNKSKIYYDKIIQTGTLVFGFLFPIAVVIIQHSILYDGLRHLLFIIPLLTVLCGISFANFIESRIKNIYKTVICFLIFSSVIITIIDMISLHPYQTIYFNRLVAGGLEKASLNFDTDYWGNSHKEGAEWLAKNYQKDSKSEIPVSVCGFSRIIMRYYFGKNTFIKKELKDILKGPFIRLVKPSFDEYNNSNPFIDADVDESEVYLALTRWNCHEKIANGEILHIIKRKNVPLLYIIKMPKN